MAKAPQEDASLGNIVSVFALLMVVVYSSNPYDLFDLIIAMLCFAYSIHVWPRAAHLLWRRSLLQFLIAASIMFALSALLALTAQILETLFSAPQTAQMVWTTLDILRVSGEGAAIITPFEGMMLLIFGALYLLPRPRS